MQKWVLSTATVQTKGPQNRHGKIYQLVITHRKSTLTPWSDTSSPFQVCYLPCMPLPNQMVFIVQPLYSSYLTSNGFSSSQRRDTALGHPSPISLQRQDYRPQKALQIFKVLMSNLHRCYSCILPVKMLQYFM